MPTLGKKLLNYRQKYGLTQVEMAKKIGVNQWHISSIETGTVTGRHGAASVSKVKTFFKALKTNQVDKTKRTRGTRKYSYKPQAAPLYVTQDPLSLKIVSELEDNHKLLWRVVLAGFAALALLIVLK